MFPTLWFNRSLETKVLVVSCVNKVKWYGQSTKNIFYYLIERTLVVPEEHSKESCFSIRGNIDTGIQIHTGPIGTSFIVSVSFPENGGVNF